MAPSTSSSSTATSVQVALRIRPPTTQDSTSIPARFQRTIIQAASSNTVAIEANAGVAQNPGPSSPSTILSSTSTPKKQYFTFDQVHAPQTTQYEMFTSTTKPLISRFLEGFNCTILAYGQTSSGKTFTMTGIELDTDPADPKNGMGIIPRAVSHIFSTARQLKEERGTAWNYSIKGSFLELYNEDLIDLLNLDDAAGGKREVQIREDKDGHIIWGGLLEVSVKNPTEVMTLLRKGTAIRRTNETDMNAQSSRSHAIFSLTLTQKKYTGMGPPPRSSSPLPPTARSPSRLARPGSVYASPGGSPAGRVSTPTFGRPSTPSLTATLGRGSLRPSSALGHVAEKSTPGDDGVGEWVTIVSKFHFVDLAGSERLKRTAAVGDRIKEGISINSGLLALGNVISALGDPSRAKSHTASYVPYRDSKLTRLLQDSLGGNAHTLMIACVSPAEWNAAETINTLKYANRARNIKNRAVINQKEEGWDDVEWLQTTVTRLRKELKALKESGVVHVSGQSSGPEGASKKVLTQMTELQNNYEDLREKFVDRTEELARLRRELGVKQRESMGGAVGGTGKYEEIVGPVIEEYEKTISAMEAELSLNRAALRHTNELVEEKEEELAVMTERHAAIELYLEELKTRVAKLTEREAHTEAYVRDLEEKMKLCDETSVTSSESLSDLRREISKFKDSEIHSAKYIVELEARLTRSDESILDLQQTMEQLERECERRSEEAEVLQRRLDNLRQDGEGWRSDLEERERKVKELEEKMTEWEKRKTEVGETRARLGSVVEEVASARRSLEISLAHTATSSNDDDIPHHKAITPASFSPTEQALESQLATLQQTHTATLADLASVSAKYRDALGEISDLAAQIQEAKLGNLSTAPSESNDSPIGDKSIEFPLPSKRRIMGGRLRDIGDPRLDAGSRRFLYRQAASTESLHLRSLSQSQSLSQELSSARTRKTSLSSHASSSHSPSSSYSFATINSAPATRPDLSIVFSPAQERSVQSLEKEIMRLQEVLKDREAEISLLEESFKDLQNEKKANRTNLYGDPNLHEPNGVNGSADPQEHLSPQTLQRFDSVRSVLVNGDSHNTSDDDVREKGVVDGDESLERLNELMLSMAQKESQHKAVVDNLTAQLNQARRQLDDLTTLSRHQALNMSTEIDALRKQYQEDLDLLAEVQTREASLVQQLKAAEDHHVATVEELRQQHEEALIAKASEMEELAAKIKSEKEVSLATLRSELQATTALLEQSRLEHEETFGKLKEEHAHELDRRMQGMNDLLHQTRDEQEKTLGRLRDEHVEALKQKEVETTNLLHTTEEEYYNALTKLRGDHAEAIKKLTAETNATIERLREEHAGQLRMAEISREGSLAESQSSLNLALKELQDEHASGIARKEACFMEEMESMQGAHTRSLKSMQDDHSLQMDRLRLDHESSMAKLNERWRLEVERLKSMAAAEQEQAAAAIKSTQRETEQLFSEAQEKHASAISDLEQRHSAEIIRLEAALQEAVNQRTAAVTGYQSTLEVEIAQLKSVHDAALKDSIAELQQQKATIVQSHAEDLQKLHSQYEQELDRLKATLESLQKDREAGLEEARAETQRLLTAEKDSFDSDLDDLNRRHAAEVNALHEERESLEQELETQKVTMHDFSLMQDETRQEHEEALSQNSLAIQSLEQSLASTAKENGDLRAVVTALRAELDKTRNEQFKLVQEASKRQSLVDELERHRSMIADLQEDLQKVKDEKDVLQFEKQRSDGLLKELQAQLARSSSPPNVRTTSDRNLSYARSTGLTALKLPPPTPPPTMPPPPAPRAPTNANADSIASTSSQSSSAMSPSTPSKELQPDTPATSISPGPLNGSFASSDLKLTTRVEQQAKQIEEQEAMIKTLNKQLTHCESDLQVHMDLVGTLETSVSDSEKNLRKARMHATELARERDNLNSQVETLKNDLAETKREVASVRRSIVEEKQSLEQRLDEERKAKERVRQQLDSRMEELQRRKSKFACL
jgi:kinesin family protein 4/21/27